MKTQQTPNLKKGKKVWFFSNIELFYPPAHDPEDAPPFSPHSALVKQVPFLKVFPLELLK